MAVQAGRYGSGVELVQWFARLRLIGRQDIPGGDRKDAEYSHDAIGRGRKRLQPMADNPSKDTAQEENQAKYENGRCQVRQDASTALQVFPVAAVIEFLSSFVTLEPGDIISTGTPAGVGNTSGDYLRPGSQVEASIGSIGTLVTPISN